MIIMENMLNEKVPIEMFPTRLDSATDLCTYTKKGLIVYNINPQDWNLLYLFFQKKNKFTIDSYEIENKDITYKELIDIFNKEYNGEYVQKRGFDESKRKQVLIDEFNETFGVSDTTISDKVDSHYELKYSKSKNVYTLYYIETYVANYIDDIEKLLNQKVFEQELIDLNKYPIEKEINGIKFVESLSFLDDKEKLELIKKNIL